MTIAAPYPGTFRATATLSVTDNEENSDADPVTIDSGRRLWENAGAAATGTVTPRGSIDSELTVSLISSDHG